MVILGCNAAPIGSGLKKPKATPNPNLTTTPTPRNYSGQQKTEEWQTLVDRLSRADSLSEADATELSRKHILSNIRVVQGLTNILQSPEDRPRAKAFTIDMLQMLGDNKKICRALSQSIIWGAADPQNPGAIRTMGSSNSVTIRTNYPVANALIELGGNSVPFMLNNLKTSDVALERTLSLSVMRSIDGLYVAQFRLQRAIQIEQNPKVRARLQAALKQLPSAGVYPSEESENVGLDDPVGDSALYAIMHPKSH